jgi:hypothetical protein
MRTPCTGCDTDKETRSGQWWFLRDYFGVSGQFCPDCYDKISHDSYGRPEHPEEYTLMLLKLCNP